MQVILILLVFGVYIVEAVHSQAIWLIHEEAVPESDLFHTSIMEFARVKGCC